MVAPEHAAPAIPTTPASINVCAPVAAVVASQPESAVTSENWKVSGLTVFMYCIATAAAIVNPRA